MYVIQDPAVISQTSIQRQVRSPAKGWVPTAAIVLGLLGFAFGPSNAMAGLVATAPETNQASLTDSRDGNADLIEVQQAATKGVLSFPFLGKITRWEIFFKYTTQCENDHFVSLTSPRGKKLILMDRGQGRCSGKAATFESSNDNDAGAFLGTRAKGDWKFRMIDLDKNDLAGTLDEVWMILTVNDNGTVSEHKVSLDGLPSPIPIDRR